MMGYPTEEVARLLGLSPAQIRSYTRAGFLSPARDARGNLRFTFQDLVLLKAAKGLMAARIPAAKIRGSLRRLKQQLPRGRALSELRITAEGHRVVARDRKSTRLNSSHGYISYAVFCLKKKKNYRRLPLHSTDRT